MAETENPICPKCNNPAECSHKEIFDVNFQDEYTLTCPKCGYSDSYIENDYSGNGTDFAYCGAPCSMHPAYI